MSHDFVEFCWLYFSTFLDIFYETKLVCPNSLKGDDFLEKLGKQTIKFNTPPTIVDCASIVGPKEAQGPLAKYFDQTLDDEFWGEKTWEKAESKIIKETVNTVISKSGVPASNFF